MSKPLFQRRFSDSHEDIKPPKIAIRLLKAIYAETIVDDVLGDLNELFEAKLKTSGPLAAKTQYWLDVVSSIRNINLRKKRSYPMNPQITAMLRNYWKVSLRSISKNKVYSTLNIVGLAFGLAACFFILQYVSHERSYDKFHTNHENLYRIRYKVFHNNELRIDCAAAVPRVGPFMKEKMPEVVDFARAYPMSSVVSYEDVRFREDRIHIADPAFLNIFTFPLISGDSKTALTKANSVVISESVARKFFGEDDPLGKILKFGRDRKAEVTGVAKDVPVNSHIKFDYLISYQTLNNETENESETAWGWYDFNTYVLLREGTNPEEFDAKFQGYINEELKERFEKYNSRSEFPLQAVTDIHLYSNLLQESEPTEQGDGEAVFFLTLIAFFILIIAWINYINLSTAKSIERSREVGIRKVVGAVKKQLVQQFIFESLVINLIAFICAMIMVVFGMPYFNQITGLALDFSFLKDVDFWSIALTLLFVGALLSGVYPAFVLSSFKPVSVLKGKTSNQKSGIQLRKALVVFQFIASVTLISGTLVVYKQLNYMRTLNLGFDIKETMVVKAPGVYGADSVHMERIRSFKQSVLNASQVSSVASSSNVPGDEIFWTNGIKKTGEPQSAIKTIYVVGIDHDYFPTYDIKFLAGRNFARSFTMDTAHVIINGTAAKYLGFDSPEAAIDQKVDFWQGKRTIVGVVDDYNQMSAKNAISPLIFRLVLDYSSYFTFKLDSENYQDTFNRIEAQYHSFFPGNPFDYFFLDAFFNRQYAGDVRFSKVFSIFAALAIFVACLGLFGLSSFSTTQRTKEIGIRKSLGATIPNIVLLLSREFILLIILANFIAWPLTYFIMDSWLDSFANRIGLDLSIFLFSALCVILVAIVTVGYKTISTARSNPVKALRYE